MYKLLSILSIFLLTASASEGQTLTPLQLAEKIFGKEPFPGLRKHSTCDYKGKPSGADLRPGTTTKFLLISETESQAVVSMTLLDPEGNGFDGYLHFRKEKIWKLCAFRALALTGMIEQAKEALERLSPQQVDSIVKSANISIKNEQEALFTTKKEYEFLLGNARLTVALDDSIIAHFNKHRKEFENIRDTVLKELKEYTASKREQASEPDRLRSQYSRLFIRKVSGSKDQFGYSVDFLIGGMVDNLVAYLYVEDPRDLPQMVPDRLILLREIGNGWYIYKTT